MSTAILPTYPDLFTLPQDELEVVERACRLAKHLSDDEKLLDRISEDKKPLDACGLDKMDIYRNHRNMNMIFNDTTAEKCSDDEKKIMDSFMIKFTKDIRPAGFGECWCCWGRITMKIKMNNRTFLVSNITWGGAEQCPIEKYFSPKSYFGYERGSSDWFVVELCNLQSDKSTNALWIPDLLPAQIGMFGFAQSPYAIDSGIKGYRLDLARYIELFDIKNTITLLPTVEKNKWSFSGNFIKIPDETVKLKECTTKKYYAFTYVWNDKIVMAIKFYEDKDEEEENIEIFGSKCSYMIQNKDNYSRYELSSFLSLAP